jgi:cytoskeletal protein RodZ
MYSVGETLRRARQAQGLDLPAVAARTKISAKYLEAIESDNRKVLPGGFFYKSFVDQYARSLSLDTREIDTEIDRVLAADEPLPLPGFESVVARNVPPMPFARRFHLKRWIASAATLALVVVGCSGVYVWWHGARSSFNVQGALASFRSFRKPVAAEARTVAVKPKIARPVVTPVAEVASIPAATPAVAPRTPSPSEFKVMLDLMAHEATWLSVTSDGKPVFSGTLRANESKTVGGKQFAKLRVGNAAGLEVRLNGKLLGPLGARGQVLTVLFTPDNFQIFSPPKESD